jgi:hypothetical protein
MKKLSHEQSSIFFQKGAEKEEYSTTFTRNRDDHSNATTYHMRKIEPPLIILPFGDCSVGLPVPLGLGTIGVVGLPPSKV